MKSKTLIALIVLLLVAAIGDAEARHGHRHFGHRHSHGPVLSFGFVYGPYWGPWHYPPYYSPIIVQRVPPPVYIERGDAETVGAPAASGYWYYCDETGGYYPYVKECPGGWQQVPPKPTGQP